MKAFLMHRDRDFDLKQELPPNAAAVAQDLELTTLVNAMALEDKLVLEVTQVALLAGLGASRDSILYRQHILKDCLRNPDIVRHVYDLAGDAIEKERKNFWRWSDYPAGILHRAVEVLEMFVGMLKLLRAVGDEHAEKFQSEGFSNLFAMLKRELGPEYFREVQAHLKRLRFRNGVLMSAELGKGNKGTGYVLRRPIKELNWLEDWLERLFMQGPPSYGFHIPPRDENGAKALAELQERGINLVANALARSTDHILGFFTMLRVELAFYVGCLNLKEKLAAKGEPTCYPLPSASNDRTLSFNGLYDVCLALRTVPRVVGNDLNADCKSLLMVTGANQGGKTTFLRSLGLGQLMMQCGMFAPATTFSSSICDGLFTHFRREEDASMKSGKFDEELSRMDALVDVITPNSLFLFNESFAATNEREGSEIAGQITSALLNKGVRVVFVTHLYTFARNLFAKMADDAVFLRADRRSGAERNFKLLRAEPLQTSFGPDLYEKVFGVAELVA